MARIGYYVDIHRVICSTFLALVELQHPLALTAIWVGLLAGDLLCYWRAAQLMVKTKIGNCAWRIVDKKPMVIYGIR